MKRSEDERGLSQMSTTVRAAAALLDASYQIDDTTKADMWREMAVEARQEYDRLRAERDGYLKELLALREQLNAALSPRSYLPPGEERRDSLLAIALKERDEARAAIQYTFRGGYIEDESGAKWWSHELLTKVEQERDEALEVIRLILEADCLRPHAFERGDDDASIYELCRHLLGKS